MEFLDEKILDNTIRSYLLVAAVIALVFLMKHFFSYYLVSFTLRMLNKNWKVEDSIFRKLVVRPFSWVLVIIVSVVALDKLTFPAAWNIGIYGTTMGRLVEAIGVCAIILAIVRFILKLVDFIALLLKQANLKRGDQAEYQMISFFRDFLKVAIGIIGFLWLIHTGLGRPIGPLLTGLSIVGAALALAAKESLENLIASFIIFVDKPFYVGDLLTVNNITGTVERIGLRSTRIRTGEKTLVTIPNKQMVDGIVDNLTMRTQRRGEIRLEFDSGAPGEKLKELLQYIKELLGARKDHVQSFSAFLRDLDKNGILLVVEYFAEPLDYTNYLAVKQEFILAIRKKMVELDLELQRTSTNIRIVGDEGPQPPQPNPII